VFAQFLNPEILRLYGISRRLAPQAILERALLITRYAVLVTEHDVILPRSYLHEVPLIDAYLGRLKSVRAAGLLSVASESADATVYLARKRREYRGELMLFDAYGTEGDELVEDLVWAPRMRRSAAADIAADWRAELRPGGIWDELLAAGARPLVDRRISLLESAIDSVPDRLEGRAFILRFAKPLLPLDPDAQGETRVDFLISRAYLRSYLSEYQALVLADTPLGDLSCDLSEYSEDGVLQVVSMRRLAEFFDALGIRLIIERRLTWPTLLSLRAQPVFQWTMGLVLTTQEPELAQAAAAMLRSRYQGPVASRSRLLPQVLERLWEFFRTVQPALHAPAEGAQTMQPPSSGMAPRPTRPAPIWVPVPKIRPNDVFLVCGRDDRANSGMKEMLRAATITPVEWEEAVSWTGTGSPYVLDVIKTAFTRVQAVLVLFTPDEEVRLLDQHLRPSDPDYEKQPGRQARPNVLVEAGMALAVHPRRTVVVEIPPLRPLSDLQGLHTLRFDGTPQSRQGVIDRLRTAGCEPRGSDYLSAGFEYLLGPS
jgi:predicted nucleotide-binding protein